MQSTPDERIDHARNRFGHARQQITRLPDTPSTRAAVDLIDEGLHSLTLVPKFPPMQTGEASLFFEGATLEQAVSMVLTAACDDTPSEDVIARVTEKMAGFFSDFELNLLSGQIVGQIGSPVPAGGPTKTSQAGLPRTPFRPWGRKP